MLILSLVLLFLAGFIQDILLTSYHKALISEKNLLASALSWLICVIAMLVTTHIIFAIHSYTNLYSFVLVAIFATGKAVGCYLSLEWWSKKEKIVKKRNNC